MTDLRLTRKFLPLPAPQSPLGFQPCSMASADPLVWGPLGEVTQDATGSEIPCEPFQRAAGSSAAAMAAKGPPLEPDRVAASWASADTCHLTPSIIPSVEASCEIDDDRTPPQVHNPLR